jgi:uncharacterized protein
MGQRFEYSFAVAAPVDRVWSYLTDPFRVAPALPGATITEKVDERTYAGTVTVKVGPVSARYKGTARFETLDIATHTAEMAATAQDTSGRGGADMRMTSRLAPRGDGGTDVTVVSEVNVTGIMAQFGRGLMQDVSNQLFQRFTEAVRAELERPVETPAPPVAGGSVAADDTPAAPAAAPPPPAAAPPIEVLSFGGRVAGQAALRGLRQPAFWIAALVALTVLFWLWAR